MAERPVSDYTRIQQLEAALRRLHDWALAQQGDCMFSGDHPIAQAAAVLAGVDVPVVPDDVWEALQRMIENAASLGPACQEDALLIARWRGQFVAARERAASGVQGTQAPPCSIEHATELARFVAPNYGYGPKGSGQEWDRCYALSPLQLAAIITRTLGVPAAAPLVTGAGWSWTGHDPKDDAIGVKGPEHG